MKGGGRGYIIYIRARNMCAQTEAGKRENRDSGYDKNRKTSCSSFTKQNVSLLLLLTQNEM